MRLPSKGKASGRIASWVFHDLVVDDVALFARLVFDPGKHHHFIFLELDALRERRPLARLDVVGHALAKMQRAVFAPDRTGAARQFTVRIEFGARHRHDETIDVGHGNLLNLK